MDINICLFGDSITWGAWDPEHGGWGARLRRFFETSSLGEVAIYNCGVSGDTTYELLKRLRVEAESREPNIIILAIGINDSQYIETKNNPHVSLLQYESNLRRLINEAKDFTNKVILLGLTSVDETKTMPIPWNKTKYYDMENVRQYNDVAKKVSESEQTSFIPMLDELNKHDLEDGLHPNPQGHEKMFAIIKDFLVSNKYLTN